MSYSRDQDKVVYNINDYVIYENKLGQRGNGRICTFIDKEVIVLTDKFNYEKAQSVISVIKYESNGLILLIKKNGTMVHSPKNKTNYNIEEYTYRSVEYTKSISYITKNNKKLIIFNDYLIADLSITKLSDIELYENSTSAGMEYYLKTGRGSYKLKRSSLDNKQLKLSRDSNIKGKKRTYAVQENKLLLDNYFIDIYDIFDSFAYNYLVSTKGKLSKTSMAGKLYKHNYIKNIHSDGYIQIQDIDRIQLSVNQFTYHEKIINPVSFNQLNFIDNVDEYICIYLNNYHCTRELVYDYKLNTLRNKLLYNDTSTGHTVNGFFFGCSVLWSGPLKHKGVFSGIAEVIQVDKANKSIKIKMMDGKIKKVQSYLKHLSYTPAQERSLNNNEIKFLKDISYQKELLRKSYELEKQKESKILNNYIRYDSDLITGFKTEALIAISKTNIAPTLNNNPYVSLSTPEPSITSSNHDPYAEPIIEEPKPKKKTIIYSSNKRLIIDSKQIPHLEYKKLDGKKAKYFDNCFEQVLEDKKELFIYHRGLVRVEPIVSLICVKEFVLKNSQGEHIYVNQSTKSKSKIIENGWEL